MRLHLTTSLCFLLSPKQEAETGTVIDITLISRRAEKGEERPRNRNRDPDRDVEMDRHRDRDRTQDRDREQDRARDRDMLGG